jgi:hypothetical protein
VAPELALGIVTRDMADAVRFYRLLGIDVPDPDGGHLDVTLPNGLQLMWDTEELIKQLHDVSAEPLAHRTAFAFECGSPAEVDEVYRRILEGGFRGGREPWDAFSGQR